MLVQAESREEVLQALQRDIYHTSAVWDLKSAQILPVSLDGILIPFQFAIVILTLFPVQVGVSEGSRRVLASPFG